MLLGKFPTGSSFIKYKNKSMPLQEAVKESKRNIRALRTVSDTS